MIPQIILLTLAGIGILITMFKHGETRQVRENFYRNMIFFTIEFGCLITGGFFSSWHAPQIIMTILLIIAIFGSMIVHDDLDVGTYDVYKTTFMFTISHGIFYWGGFYDVLFI